MKYTYNTFKQELKNMDDNQRREKLKELQTELMYERAVACGMGQARGSRSIRVIRRMIAITKTAIKCWR